MDRPPPKRPRSEPRGFVKLFVSLVILYIAQPFAAMLGSGAPYVLAVFYLTALITAVLAFAQRAREKWVTTVAAAVTVVATASSFVATGFWIEVSIYASYCAFFSIVCWLVIRHVFQAGEVNADRLYAVCSVYLLAGIAWAFLYATIETVFPGSFNLGPLGPSGDPAPPLVYFSLVTITTLGYGEITPLSPVARTFASLEAAFGQIYLAVLVARLLGFQMTEGTQGAEEA
ncbi:MAG: ion channel [Myxococcota bacterium]